MTGEREEPVKRRWTRENGALSVRVSGSPDATKFQ
jgi:hypothetical protein